MSRLSYTVDTANYTHTHKKNKHKPGSFASALVLEALPERLMS